MGRLFLMLLYKDNDSKYATCITLNYCYANCLRAKIIVFDF